MADSTPTYTNRFLAEVFGTFVLVFGVGGAALFATIFGSSQNGYNGAGFLGVALALGLSVMAAMYAVGGVSGGHFNPAVTLGLAIGRRFAWRDVLGYVVAQLIGGLIASSVLYIVTMFGPDGLLTYLVDARFGSNGFGEGTALNFSLVAAMIMTTVTSAIFVWVFLGATDKPATAAFAPIAVGFVLVVVSIISVPVTGGAINPALSIANAIYGGQLALSQVWVFIVFPIVGGLIAGISYGPLFGRSVKKTETKSVVTSPAAAPAATAAKKPAARTTTKK
ncbi:MAG: aquaporin [Aurantimicrobium sp.]|nr:aquaporin [Aurantimicrobium sp.]